jgi:hypothetical protein
MTSMEAELAHPVDIAQVKEAVTQAFGSVFEREIVSVAALKEMSRVRKQGS